MSDPEHDDHSSVDVWEDEGGNNDDVWGNDDEVSYDRAIAQKEWDRLHENFGNTGYREGIEEGKEGTLQQGFNQGWSEGVQYGHELGRLRGLISPLLEYIRLSSPTSAQNGPLGHIKDKEGWITRATQVVKELVELDIAKVFDKAYFDDGRGPSSSTSGKEKKDGCCGGGGGNTGEGSNGSSSCCQEKAEADVVAGSQKSAHESSVAAAGAETSESSESSTPSKGCCGGGGGNGGEGSCQSNKSSSCKKDDKKTIESEWSSRPEQVVNEYRSRVRALLLEVNMDALSHTV